MSSAERTTPRRVAISIDVRNVYARELVRGIVRYASECANWSTCDLSQMADRRLADNLRNCRADGVLAWIANRREARTICSSGMPAVDLCGLLRDTSLPTVRPDEESVAQMAIEHLTNRGFRRFAYVVAGNNNRFPDINVRVRQFRAAVAANGIPCDEFQMQCDKKTTAERARLSTWIESLPKPVGIVTCDDNYGVLALECCRNVGVIVPTMAAVLGIGDDDCLCSLSSPTLSSIDLNTQRIGFEAARLLDRLIKGEPADAQDILVEPRGIVTRMSTDVLAAKDQCVTRAVEFIRRRACSRIGVSDVANHVKVSRTALELRFNRTLQRTVFQEIRRVQIERVKELLLTTDAPLKQIATQTGFYYEEYMMRVFRKYTGETMNQYRARMKYDYNNRTADS